MKTYILKSHQYVLTLKLWEIGCVREVANIKPAKLLFLTNHFNELIVERFQAILVNPEKLRLRKLKYRKIHVNTVFWMYYIIS